VWLRLEIAECSSIGESDAVGKLQENVVSEVLFDVRVVIAHSLCCRMITARFDLTYDYE